MTDDLVKRLRKEADEWTECCGDIHQPLLAAAERIEELEGKLAKAGEALGGMVGLFSADSLLLKGTHLNMELDNARTALAELSSTMKGQDDE